MWWVWVMDEATAVRARPGPPGDSVPHVAVGPSASLARHCSALAADIFDVSLRKAEDNSLAIFVSVEARKRTVKQMRHVRRERAGCSATGGGWLRNG